MNARAKVGLVDRMMEKVGGMIDRFLAPDPHEINDVDCAKWLEHLHDQRLRRSEPNWGDLNKWMRPDLVKLLLPSLQQHELSDDWESGRLVAFNAGRFVRRHPDFAEVIEAWLAGQKEHARLLGRAVDRFDGVHIDQHWCISLFARARRIFGVRFELQALLITEIVGSAYYRILERRANDDPVKQMCDVIIRDKSGHVAFHLDRLAMADRSILALTRKAWETQFRMMGHVTAILLWVNHGPCLMPLGADTEEFFREVQAGISDFVIQLRRRTESRMWCSPSSYGRTIEEEGA